MRGRVCAGRPEGRVKASNAMELACGRLEGPGGQVTLTPSQQRLPKVKNRKYLLSKSKTPQLCALAFDTHLCIYTHVL